MDQLQIIILLAMFAVMYFLIIRPQQQKAKKQQSFIDELKKGDRVVTNGGIIAKITLVEDEQVGLSLDGKTTCMFVKSAISQELTEALNKNNA